MLETEYRVPGCNAMTAAILKIVFFVYIPKIYCPIDAKFGVKKQNHVQAQVTNQNS